jgi:2-dehydropantoate 2-reductase
MNNPITAATGLSTPACLSDPAIRRFAIQVAGEGVRVGQALGYPLEKIRGVDPQVLALAAEGDVDSLKIIEPQLTPKANPRGDIQRPSMAQDILKGRRTEIDAMNGFIARKGATLGIATPANEKITSLVTRIERGDLKPSPSHLKT